MNEMKGKGGLKFEIFDNFSFGIIEFMKLKIHVI